MHHVTYFPHFSFLVLSLEISLCCFLLNLKLAYIEAMRSYKLSNEVLLCFPCKVFVFVLKFPDHSSVLYFPRAILTMVSQERH